LASHIREYLENESLDSTDPNTIVFDPEKEKQKQIKTKLKRGTLNSLDVSGKEEESTCFAGVAAPHHKTVIKEHSLKYEIVLNKGPATGLYIDQRDNRRKFRELILNMKSTTNSSTPSHSRSVRSIDVDEKTFLNTFSYTCSFSLHAAQCQMKTTNVDLSKTILTRAKKVLSFFLLNLK
jgi:23S rRNA G2069 N7-methylase RlmK/C1962 C5-methylase RlmI